MPIYDLEFANAVRKAATGLRTTAKCDPEKEAAPLAAILRSERTLDVDGLELLARLVTGDLKKAIARPAESLLANAVRRAGKAWRGAKDAKPSVQGWPLAEALRGGVVLGPGERSLLADLVTGELRRVVGRRQKGAGLAEVIAVVAAFRQRIENGAIRKNAVVDTADEFGLSESTVENYLAIKAQRDAASDT